MRYGVPYKGSKNGIAEWIYKQLPIRTNFYDLFAGGCAITQIALMKGEYKNYFCNDIDPDGIKLFLNAIYGKYENENRWISRADFFRLKDKDPYIKYCWSYGNNGRDYLYSKEIEQCKKAWHFAIYENDFSLAKDLGIDFSPIQEIKDIYEKYIKTKRIWKKM
jgi:site-specific DNA-adenine methylase